MPGEASSVRQAFRDLHESGTFVMPNAWDAGSARLLESVGFAAIATTSSGFAASLGRRDQRISIDELVEHALTLVKSVAIPVSVDAENGYSSEPDGVADSIRRIGETGAAGVSIEDYDPSGFVYPKDVATERVAAAVEAARESAMVLTARAENHLYGIHDLDDTIHRLVAFRAAGADVVYAPGVTSPRALAEIVEAVGAPVNALLQEHSPPIEELDRLGIRRISTGGALSFVAYGALVRAARQLQAGVHTYHADALSADDRRVFDT